MRAVALSRHSQFSKCERGSQTPERAGALRAPLSHADRLDPHAAFPDMRSRSLNIYSVSKNVPDRNPSGLRLHANTRPRKSIGTGWWESAWPKAGSVKAA